MKTRKIIKIVSCTKLSKDNFEFSPLGLSLKKLKAMTNETSFINSVYAQYDIEIVPRIFYDNSAGMSECYNKALDEIVDDISYPIAAVIFIHDDVLINDMFIFEKLFNEFENYDIVGVAGSKKFSISTLPVCWHASSKDSWGGFVCHPIANDSTKLQSNYFGPAPTIAAVVDGLFIAFNKTAINSKLRFDVQFEFDFYDADICLTAQKKHQLKVGISPIILTHKSHGNGINSDRYRETQEKFISKWRKGKQNEI